MIASPSTSSSRSTSTAPRRLRLGIIGTGLAVEKLHWPALSRQADRFEVVAFAEQRRESAECFAAYSGVALDRWHAGYQDLLRRDDVEAVLIALPIPHLLEAAQASLAAGKHVLCEKPPGADLDQGRAFLALPERYPDRVLLIAENFFYRDDLRLARSMLDAGAIGRLHAVTLRVVAQNVPREGAFSSTPWRQQPQYRGGPQLDAGVHFIAQLRLLAGDVERAHAGVQEANPLMDGPSHLVATLQLVNGAIGSYISIHAPTPVPRGEQGMTLYGSEGVLSLGRRSVRRLRRDGSTEEQVVEGSDGGYYNEWRNFYEAIVHDEPVVGTVAQSFHNLLLVMRLLDSAERGEVVRIEGAPGGLAAPGVPLWRPRGAAGLFDGLPVQVRAAAEAGQ